MATLLLTEGLGNGTFNGSLSKVLLEGLTPGAAEQVPFYWFILLTNSIDGTYVERADSVMLKNTSGQYFYAYAVTASTGVALSGDAANITATISKDGGAQTATTNSAVEVGSSGLYRIAAETAETNADEIVPVWTSATSGVEVIPAPAVIYTTVSNDIPTVLPGGALNPIIIGDDYLAANGQNFSWDFTPPDDTTVASGSCKFGGGIGSATAWSVTGTLSDIGSGQFRASFDLPSASTTGLCPSNYSWSVEVTNDSGYETTIARGTVQLVRKQT